MLSCDVLMCRIFFQFSLFRMTRVCVRYLDQVGWRPTRWTRHQTPPTLPYLLTMLSQWHIKSRSTGVVSHTMNSTVEWARCIMRRTTVLLSTVSPTLPTTTTTDSVSDSCPTSIEILRLKIRGGT